MLYTYLKYAFRNLIRKRTHTLINLVGLSFSIAVIILIYLYVSKELSVDLFQVNGDRIYQVSNSAIASDGQTLHSIYTKPEMAEEIRKDVPGVEAVCRLRQTEVFIGPGNELFEEMVAFTDSTFFRMFSYEILAGDRDNPFQDLKNVVLTEHVARKLFGDSIQVLNDAIGRTVKFPEDPPGNLYTVSAVIADLPDACSHYFSVLVPYENARTGNYAQSNNYGGNTYTYVLLDKNNDIDGLRRNGQALVDKLYGKDIESYIEMGFFSEDHQFTLDFTPFRETYLGMEEYGRDYSLTGNSISLYILSSIGVLILLIACFNYVMISIGTAMNRLGDFGMMNVVGARRWQVLAQFVMESLLLTMISLFLGIIFAEQLLPVFNNLAGEDLRFTLYQSTRNILFLATLLTFIVGSTSSYVGFYLFRRNQPLRLLRKEMLSMRRNGVARFSVVLQFFIAIALLISGIVIIKQLSYMVNRDVGFEKEGTLVIHVDFEEQRINTLKECFLSSPLVNGVTMSDRSFNSGSSSTLLQKPDGELITIRFLRVDEDYLKAFGLDLVQGRNFDPGETVKDSIPLVLVNETFVKQLELDDPVGQQVKLENGDLVLEIIGVVRDFHFDSMHDEIQPLIMYTTDNNSIWFLFVKADESQMAAVLEHCEKCWKEIVPEFNWEYSFLDDILKEQYQGEDRWSRIIAYAAAIAIFLSCLGLMGISGLMVARRYKEIGIRKVNGATVPQIILLLNADILKWILVSFVIACPAAWFAMHRWLQDFAFRIRLYWWIFALAGLAALLISILTVTMQIIRVARQNPVKALRYE
jgi:putative ABC transport system permease protein